MNYEVKDCIDCGSEYCPCHLAETGDCILCSQLSGKKFCDCINWRGVCIYQEFLKNGGKAKSGRKTISCDIIKKQILEDKILILTISVPYKLCQDLIHAGSYVFLRSPSTTFYYDTPISVMDVDLDESTIKLAIEIKGVKTKSLAEINEGEKILVRAPYWNGVLGLKNVYKAKEGLSVVICRGIGMAPMIPVIKKLHANGNKILILLDKGGYESTFVQNYISSINAEVIYCNTMTKGALSEDFKSIMSNILAIEKERLNLIHIDGPDILIYNVIKFVDSINDTIKLASSNNSKMCCGEGICGTCTSRYEGHVVKRLCKVQVDPRYVFKGKRLI